MNKKLVSIISIIFVVISASSQFLCNHGKSILECIGIFKKNPDFLTTNYQRKNPIEDIVLINVGNSAVASTATFSF